MSRLLSAPPLLRRPGGRARLGSVTRSTASRWLGATTALRALGLLSFIFGFATTFTLGFPVRSVATLSGRRLNLGGRVVDVDVLVRTVGASAAFPSLENRPARGCMVVSAVVAVFANSVTVVPTWAFALFPVWRPATNTGICNVFYPSHCS